MIEEGLFSRLKDDATLGPLVTTGAKTRIYPVISEENAPLPYIVYSNITGDQISSLDGPSGLDRRRIQFDAYAPTFAQAKALAAAIRASLDGFTGVLPDGTQVDSCSMQLGPLDFFEDTPRSFRVMQDFEVWFNS